MIYSDNHLYISQLILLPIHLCLSFEQEILELFEVIDGSKKDENVFPMVPAGQPVEKIRLE